MFSRCTGRFYLLSDSLARPAVNVLREDDGLQGLTSKQFLFANLVIQGLSKTEAYSRVYDVSNMLQETIYKKANEVFNNEKVQAKVRELRLDIERQSTLAPTLTREWILNGIMGIALNGDKDSTRLRAYEDLGKVAGIDLFRETTRVERVTRTPEELDQELQERLAEMAKTIEAKANPPGIEPDNKPTGPTPASARDRRRKPAG